MNISKSKEEKGFGFYHATSHGEPCEICKKHPAHRHYNHYYVCTSCFIDFLDEEKRGKSHDGDDPYVQLLDRWNINGTKEERIIGLTKIHHVKPLHPRLPSSYVKDYKEYDCDEDWAVNVFPKVEIKEGNPFYEEAKGYSAASRTYLKLRSFVERNSIEGKEKGVALCKLVLTFPEGLSRYYYESGERERPWRVFKEFWERMHEEFCIADSDRKIREKLGCVVNMHTWSTKEPLKPHYHFHLSMMNVVSGEKEKIRFSPVIYGAILEGLKEKWRVLLEEEGKSLWGDDYEVGCIDMHYSFVGLEKKRKVLHSLKYQYRQWVVDFCDWSDETSYVGGIPERMWGYKNRARVYGFWKRLGSDEETEKEIKEMRKGRKKVCPFCGGMTKYIGEETPEEVWKKENLEWYEFDRGKLKKTERPSKEFFDYLCLPDEMCSEEMRERWRRREKKSKTI